MNYQMEIKENVLLIQGLFGKYEAKSTGKGFDASVARNECVAELDENGEEYLIDAGQEWNIPLEDITELGNFMRQCEEERLWNYTPGPVFRMKADPDNGTVFLKGVTKNFFLGADEKGLYLDDAQATKTHRYVKTLLDAMHLVTREDQWWSRLAVETMEILRNSKSFASVTDGGRLQLVYKDKSYRIGQKEDLSYWINVSADQERHIYYKESWKEVLGLL